MESQGKMNNLMDRMILFCVTVKIGENALLIVMFCKCSKRTSHHYGNVLRPGGNSWSKSCPTHFHFLLFTLKSNTITMKKLSITQAFTTISHVNLAFIINISSTLPTFSHFFTDFSM